MFDRIILKLRNMFDCFFGRLSKSKTVLLKCFGPFPKLRWKFLGSGYETLFSIAFHHWFVVLQRVASLVWGYCDAFWSFAMLVSVRVFSGDSDCLRCWFFLGGQGET